MNWIIQKVIDCFTNGSIFKYSHTIIWIWWSRYISIPVRHIIYFFLCETIWIDRFIWSIIIFPIIINCIISIIYCFLSFSICYSVISKCWTHVIIKVCESSTTIISINVYNTLPNYFTNSFSISQCSISTTIFERRKICC